MYCCFKMNNLDLALFLFEISIKKHLTKYTIITFNYFIKILINKYGQFSEIVENTISEFIKQDIFYSDFNHNILNIYEIDSQIIPILIDCFIDNNYNQNQENNGFTIICYPNFKNPKTRRNDNYRLLYGEDNDYLLSTAYYHLQNNFCNIIDSKWTFGSDEIKCVFKTN